MKKIQAIRSERVVTPEGVRAATVRISDGKIVAVRDYEDLASGASVYDAGKSVVMPGLVDTHVHINEPGRADWEGFHSATRAAAAGGVTTLIDMPLNSIPATTTAASLEAKRAAARGKCWVNVGFWGGVVPGNASELHKLGRAGVFGFKCFLVPSGVPEFENVTQSDLRAALPIVAEMDVPLLVHAELPGPIDRAMSRLGKFDPRSYTPWMRSRPPSAEREAVEMMIGLTREFHAHVHIVHVSSRASVVLLGKAKKEGLRVTAETCPHYLAFTARGIRRGATEYKCAPPIRDLENQGALWRALEKGILDMVVSDHSPSPPTMKDRDDGNFFQAWGGIASLQLGLPVMWSKMRAKNVPFTHLARFMCSAPARLAGLEKRKGAIAVGHDADIVVWNPEKRFVVKSKMIHHRHKLTPYMGRSLHGEVQSTFLRGEMIYDGGRFLGQPRGELLWRDERVDED